MTTGTYVINSPQYGWQAFGGNLRESGGWVTVDSRDSMRRQMEDAVRAVGGEPDIRVVLDDSWSTDRISAEGREKLRNTGFAPPAPRSAGNPTLVQLSRGPFRCPWCGSTDTKLENVFGPTPCRSLRYCNACRQPFEQFETI